MAAGAAANLRSRLGLHATARRFASQTTGRSSCRSHKPLLSRWVPANFGPGARGARRAAMRAHARCVCRSSFACCCSGRAHRCSPLRAAREASPSSSMPSIYSLGRIRRRSLRSRLRLAAAAGNEAAPPARPHAPVAEIVRSEPNPVPVKAPAVAHPPAPTRDPIGNLINSSRPLGPIQRALSEFGYGPLETNGTLGPNTRAAIERFERDHKMPVTGQISDRLIRELSSMTGRHL